MIGYDTYWIYSTWRKAGMGVFGDGYGARWSMAAIDDSIGGVVNFERVTRTI